MNIKLPLIVLCLASLTPSIASADLIVEVSFNAPRNPKSPKHPRPILIHTPVRFDSETGPDFDDHDVCYEHSLQGSADSTSQFLDFLGDYAFINHWERVGGPTVWTCDETERTASFD